MAYTVIFEVPIKLLFSVHVHVHTVTKPSLARAVQAQQFFEYRLGRVAHVIRKEQFAA